jgi:hypothetical protein
MGARSGPRGGDSEILEDAIHAHAIDHRRRAHHHRDRLSEFSCPWGHFLAASRQVPPTRVALPLEALLCCGGRPVRVHERHACGSDDRVREVDRRRGRTDYTHGVDTPWGGKQDT